MTFAAWYFADEAGQPVGPYINEADATRSNELYAKWLHGDLTPEDDAEREEINRRSRDLAESLRATFARTTYMVDREEGS